MQIAEIALRKRIGRLQFHLDRLLAALSNRPKARRVVFLHIPKCAGRSVNGLFKSYFGSGRSKWVVGINDREQGPKYREAVARAPDALFVHGHFGFETLEKIRGDAVVFTVLRNPYDRLRSAYGHLTARTHGNPFGDRFFDMPLDTFLKSEDNDILSWTDNVMARMLAARFERASVSGMSPPQIAELALSHLPSFDHVAFVDTFEDDVAHIAAAAGVPYPRRMARKNVTAKEAAIKARRESIAPFSEEARKLAAPRLEADLAVYAAALERRERSGEAA